MYHTKTRRCDDRIVSISQPYVRPILRGKQNKPVEFGAKLSVSLDDNGFAQVDHLRWDAFHEGLDLKSQVAPIMREQGTIQKRCWLIPCMEREKTGVISKRRASTLLVLMAI